MVEFYVYRIKKLRKMTIDDVPERKRKEVERALEEQETHE